MRFTVPGNPIPKGRPRVISKNGKRWTYTPTTTKQYENLVKAYAMKARCRPTNLSVMVEIVFYRSSTRNADLDNLVKSVTDALNGVAWEDDALIEVMYAKKDYDPKNPRAEIEITIL